MPTRLDRGMVQRLIFLMIVLACATTLIKEHALKLNGNQHTPAMARKYWDMAREDLIQPKSGLLKIKNQKPISDGWGRPFFWAQMDRILISSGQDGVFHSDDDVIFMTLPDSCPSDLEHYIYKSLRQGGLNPDELPEGVSLQNSNFSLKRGQDFCPVPDLSGPDGIYRTEDDRTGYLQLMPPPQVR